MESSEIDLSEFQEGNRDDNDGGDDGNDGTGQGDALPNNADSVPVSGNTGRILINYFISPLLLLAFFTYREVILQEWVQQANKEKNL